MPDVRRAARPDRALLRAPKRIHPLSADLELLRSGELEIVGRLAGASNATFLARVTPPAVGAIDLDADAVDEEPPGMLCVYKPVAGERPLDDFPPRTLARREMAAFELSQASGWGIVPPTALRDGGPFGPGMVQQWIEVDPDADPVQMVVRADPRLRPICIFDALANNADRKVGHLLPLASGAVLGVDHGICFSAEPKLRTVLWAWRGEPLDPVELTVVGKICGALEGELGDRLRRLLSEEEVRATAERTRSLLEAARFPQPDPLRPAIPWPPC